VAPWWKHCWGGKAFGVTYSECVFVELGIQHPVSTNSIVICGLPQYLYRLSHKRHGFRKKYKMCVLMFCTALCEALLMWRRTERDMIKMCIGFHVKCRLFVSHFIETFISSTDFDKCQNIKFNWNLSIINGVVPHGQTDRRTNVTLIVDFSNFAKAHKNEHR